MIQNDRDSWRLMENAENVLNVKIVVFHNRKLHAKICFFFYSLFIIFKLIKYTQMADINLSYFYP